MWCPVHGSGAGCKCGYAVTLAALLQLGCGPALEQAMAPDACSQEIVRLEGLRNTEVLAACYGKDFDDCPAVISIDAKYDPLIAAQVRCGQ